VLFAMNQRLFVAFGIFLLALGILGCLAAAKDGRPRLNAEKFKDIRPGMTQAEVVDLLGAPPGDYARNGYVLPVYGVVTADGVTRKEWIDDDRVYEVHYNREGKVVGTHARANLINSP
jgi:hypothetical protein